MSAYTTQAAIQGEIQNSDLISLTDDAPVQGRVNQTVLTQVIANASGLIDQYIGNIYDIPFAIAPASVANLALTITCYKLLRRREVPDEKNKFTDGYRDALSFLKQVQKREAVLDLAATQDFSQVAADVRPTIFGWGNCLTNSM